MAAKGFVVLVLINTADETGIDGFVEMLVRVGLQLFMLLTGVNWSWRSTMVGQCDLNMDPQKTKHSSSCLYRCCFATQLFEVRLTPSKRP